jgi:hypothetical protein
MRVRVSFYDPRQVPARNSKVQVLSREGVGARECVYALRRGGYRFVGLSWG